MPDLRKQKYNKIYRSKKFERQSASKFIGAYHANRPIVWQNKIAYLAGLIDGEGYLRITKSGAIRLTIGMTDKKTIRWIYRTFGGVLGKPQKLKSGKIFYSWTMNQGKDLYYLLLLCIPYLINKKKIVTDGFIGMVNKLNKKSFTLGLMMRWGW